MRYFWQLPCPNDEFCGIGEITARYVWWWIGFRPSDNIQYFKTKFQQLLLNAENVVMGARNPNGGIIFHMLATSRKPPQVKRVHLLRSGWLIPNTFVNAYYFPTLVTDATSRKEIRRIGKNEQGTDGTVFRRAFQ